MNSQPANDPVSDEITDLAMDAMSEELSHWQVVGPLVERRQHLPDREYWNAVRTNPEVLNVRPAPTIHHLKDKANAIACVQWHGLRAGLTAVMRELAPSASIEEGGNQTAELSQYTPPDEGESA